MTRRRISKKGVSPLIATVLLIAFAVALGAVVMNWGRTYVEDTASKAKETSDTKISCSMDINMKYVQINGIQEICYNTTNNIVKFTILNTGTMKIEKLQAMVFGNKSIYVNNSLHNSSIDPSHPYRGNMSYVFASHGSIQKFSLTPAIKVPGKIDPIFCAENSLDIEDIRIC